MRELISSMMRFSGAVTMFGVEQVQNAMSAPADTQAALVRLRETLDSMSESLASKLDEPKKAALDSMSKAQSRHVRHRTAGRSNLDAARRVRRGQDQRIDFAGDGAGPPPDRRRGLKNPL